MQAVLRLNFDKKKKNMGAPYRSVNTVHSINFAFMPMDGATCHVVWHGVNVYLVSLKTVQFIGSYSRRVAVNRIHEIAYISGEFVTERRMMADDDTR